MPTCANYNAPQSASTIELGGTIPAAYANTTCGS